MKPPEFRYVAARSLDEALDVLADDEGAKILAGGQSLTPMMNFRLARPTTLVDVNRIPGLGAIRANGALRMGALVRHRAVEISPIVRERQPLLAAAAVEVGHLAIRNRGTLCGSLAHADPAAEFPMAALLLDATMRVRGTAGERIVPAREFFVTYLTSALAAGEMLVEVEFPDLPPRTGWGFAELARRHGDFAIAAVAATVTLDGGRITGARIAMGGVGATPLRPSRAEALLFGQKPDEDVLRGAAASARDEADPTSDVHGSPDFRRHLVEVLASRTLRAACERASKT